MPEGQGQRRLVALEDQAHGGVHQHRRRQPGHQLQGVGALGATDGEHRDRLLLLVLYDLQDLAELAGRGRGRAGGGGTRHALHAPVTELGGGPLRPIRGGRRGARCLGLRQGDARQERAKRRQQSLPPAVLGKLSHAVSASNSMIAENRVVLVLQSFGEDESDPAPRPPPTGHPAASGTGRRTVPPHSCTSSLSRGP